MKNTNPGCLSIFFPKIRKQSSSWEQPEKLYRLNKSLVSPAELNFYKVLTSIMGTRATVQLKVRLGDIFEPNTREYIHRNKINQKHIDFLVCNAETMEPIIGIELDDRSHERQDRKDRDGLVDRVFEAAGLPLLHVRAVREYNPDELKIAIKKALEPNNQQ